MRQLTTSQLSRPSNHLGRQKRGDGQTARRAWRLPPINSGRSPDPFGRIHGLTGPCAYRFELARGPYLLPLAMCGLVYVRPLAAYWPFLSYE